MCYNRHGLTNKALQESKTYLNVLLYCKTVCAAYIQFNTDFTHYNSAVLAVTRGGATNRNNLSPQIHHTMVFMVIFFDKSTHKRVKIAVKNILRDGVFL